MNSAQFSTIGFKAKKINFNQIKINQITCKEF
jgi:hypothetical protein